MYFIVILEPVVCKIVAFYRFSDDPMSRIYGDTRRKVPVGVMRQCAYVVAQFARDAQAHITRIREIRT